jgi:hypothetical protein
MLSVQPSELRWMIAPRPGRLPQLRGSGAAGSPAGDRRNLAGTYTLSQSYTLKTLAGGLS